MAKAWDVGIKLPYAGGKGGKGQRKYPLSEMPVGASIVMSVRGTNGAWQIVNAYRQRGDITDQQFTSRKLQENGKTVIRVWRVK